MKNNGKIGILCYSLFAGGAERNAINIALYFKQRKISFDLILFKSINEYVDEYGKKLTNLPIISILPFQQPIPIICKPFLYPYFFISLLFTVMRGKYSVLVGSVEYDPFYLTVFMAKLFNIKSILIVGNNIPEELLRFNRPVRIIVQRLFRWSFIHSSKIVCSSQDLAKNIIEYFSLNPLQVVSIYNGVNLTIIQQKVLRNKHVFSRSRAIVYMGRLVEKKGITHLINAFHEVSKHLLSSTLTIVGKGPLEKKLKTQVATLDLTNRIFFVGFVKVNPYKIFSRMNLLVFPSLYEGFGNVIIEAMYCGLPVISTNCPHGPSEIFGCKKTYLETFEYAKWGVLTPYIKYSDLPVDVEKKEQIMAKAIINVLKSKKTQELYSKAGKIRATHFSSNRMAQSLLTEINKINT